MTEIERLRAALVTILRDVAIHSDARKALDLISRAAFEALRGASEDELKKPFTAEIQVPTPGRYAAHWTGTGFQLEYLGPVA